jgi:hypothetical protein
LCHGQKLVNATGDLGAEEGTVETGARPRGMNSPETLAALGIRIEVIDNRDLIPTG